MPGWSLNPFWEEEVAIEDCDSDAFPPSQRLAHPISTPTQPELPSQTLTSPSTSKKGRKEPDANVKKRRNTKAKAAKEKELFGTCSETEDEVAPAASKPVVKRKRLESNEKQAERANSSTPRPVQAALLQSYLSQRGSSGYTTQRNPVKAGDYFIELRVYNSREVERLSSDKRWKQALVTLKVATDTNTPLWRAAANVIKEGKEEFKSVQPVMYPVTEIGK